MPKILPFNGQRVKQLMSQFEERRRQDRVPVDVFFDFGARPEDISSFGSPIVWHLHPSSRRQVILTPIPVAAFIERLCTARPFRRIRIKRAKRPLPIIPMPPFRRRRYPESFQQYWRRKRRWRPRF